MNKLPLLLCAGFLWAGTGRAQITVAPEAGLNLATMAMKVTNLASGSFTYATSLKPGLAIGAIADIHIRTGLYFQPGLFYEMTGTKLTAGYENSGGSWNINTLKLPLNLEYKFGRPGGNRFFAGTGPYYAVNISGNYKYDTDPQYNQYSASGPLRIGTTAPTVGGKGPFDDLKPIDFGWGINAGYQLAMGVYVRVHYQLGFVNLDPLSDKYDAYKSSAAGITAGYCIHAHNAAKGTATTK